MADVLTYRGKRITGSRSLQSAVRAAQSSGESAGVADLGAAS